METQVNLDSTSDGLVRLTYQADDTTPTSESKTTHHTPASIGPSPLRVVDQTGQADDCCLGEGVNGAAHSGHNVGGAAQAGWVMPPPPASNIVLEQTPDGKVRLFTDEKSVDGYKMARTRPGSQTVRLQQSLAKEMTGSLSARLESKQGSSRPSPRTDERPRHGRRHSEDFSSSIDVIPRSLSTSKSKPVSPRPALDASMTNTVIRRLDLSGAEAPVTQTEPSQATANSSAKASLDPSSVITAPINALTGSRVNEHHDPPQARSVPPPNPYLEFARAVAPVPRLNLSAISSPNAKPNPQVKPLTGASHLVPRLDLSSVTDPKGIQHSRPPVKEGSQAARSQTSREYSFPAGAQRRWAGVPERLDIRRSLDAPILGSPISVASSDSPTDLPQPASLEGPAKCSTPGSNHAGAAPPVPRLNLSAISVRTDVAGTMGKGKSPALPVPRLDLSAVTAAASPPETPRMAVPRLDLSAVTASGATTSTQPKAGAKVPVPRLNLSAVTAAAPPPETPRMAPATTATKVPVPRLNLSAVTATSPPETLHLAEPHVSVYPTTTTTKPTLGAPSASTSQVLVPQLDLSAVTASPSGQAKRAVQDSAAPSAAVLNPSNMPKTEAMVSPRGPRVAHASRHANMPSGARHNSPVRTRENSRKSTRNVSRVSSRSASRASSRMNSRANSRATSRKTSPTHRQRTEPSTRHTTPIESLKSTPFASPIASKQVSRCSTAASTPFVSPREHHEHHDTADVLTYNPLAMPTPRSSGYSSFGDESSFDFTSDFGQLTDLSDSDAARGAPGGGGRALRSPSGGGMRSPRTSGDGTERSLLPVSRMEGVPEGGRVAADLWSPRVAWDAPRMTPRMRALQLGEQMAHSGGPRGETRNAALEAHPLCQQERLPAEIDETQLQAERAMWTPWKPKVPDPVAKAGVGAGHRQRSQSRVGKRNVSGQLSNVSSSPSLSQGISPHASTPGSVSTAGPAKDGVEQEPLDWDACKARGISVNPQAAWWRAPEAVEQQTPPPTDSPFQEGTLVGAPNGAILNPLVEPWRAAEPETAAEGGAASARPVRNS
eukprot:gene6617-7924_t